MSSGKSQPKRHYEEPSGQTNYVNGCDEAISRLKLSSQTEIASSLIFFLEFMIS